MYLRGSKWSYTRRRRRTSPVRIGILAVLVAAAVYINQVIVPVTPPLFIPTATPTRSPESFVTEAEALLKEGKISQAVGSFNNAIQSDPRNAANYIALARLQIYTGKYEEAITSAENALLISPNNAMAHALKGWALGFMGDYLPAESSVKEAIKLDPNNAVPYAYLAEIIALQIQENQGQLGSLEKAIEASRTAETLAPNAMETRRARGFVLEITSNYEEAMAQYEAAVELEPNISDLHLSLGRIYRQLQMYDKAVEEFNRANSLNPTDPLPLTYISRTYAAIGEYPKGIQFGQQAIKISPQDPFLYGNVGVMEYRMKDYEKAIEFLKLAVRGGNTPEGIEIEGLPLDYGRVAEYYYIYGLSLARLGDCSEALQISQIISQGVPNDETALFNAQEMLNICREGPISPLSSDTKTPEGDSTPTAEETPSPAAGN